MIPESTSNTSVKYIARPPPVTYINHPENLSESDKTIYERNNARLKQLEEQLHDVSTFGTACDELIEWLKDDRAYNTYNENSLIACIAAIYEHANNFGRWSSLQILRLAARQKPRDGGLSEQAVAYIKECYSELHNVTTGRRPSDTSVASTNSNGNVNSPMASTAQVPLLPQSPITNNTAISSTNFNQLVRSLMDPNFSPLSPVSVTPSPHTSPYFKNTVAVNGNQGNTTTGVDEASMNLGANNINIGSSTTHDSIVIPSESTLPQYFNRSQIEAELQRRQLTPQQLTAIQHLKTREKPQMRQQSQNVPNLLPETSTAYQNGNVQAQLMQQQAAAQKHFSPQDMRHASQSPTAQSFPQNQRVAPPQMQQASQFNQQAYNPHNMQQLIQRQQLFQRQMQQQRHHQLQQQQQQLYQQQLNQQQLNQQQLNQQQLNQQQLNKQQLNPQQLNQQQLNQQRIQQFQHYTQQSLVKHLSQQQMTQIAQQRALQMSHQQPLIQQYFTATQPTQSSGSISNPTTPVASSLPTNAGNPPPSFSMPDIASASPPTSAPIDTPVSSARAGTSTAPIPSTTSTINPGMIQLVTPAAALATTNTTAQTVTSSTTITEPQLIQTGGMATQLVVPPRQPVTVVAKTTTTVIPSSSHFAPAFPPAVNISTLHLPGGGKSYQNGNVIATIDHPEANKLRFKFKTGYVISPFNIQDEGKTVKKQFFLGSEDFRRTWKGPNTTFKHTDGKIGLTLVFNCHKEKYAETKCEWPQAIVVELNGKKLPLERRIRQVTPTGTLFHGKDQPFDLTNWVLQGTNVLTVNHPRNVSCKSYNFSIQKYDRFSENHIRKVVAASMIPLIETEKLLHRLLGEEISENNDDEVLVIQESLKVSLKCPVTMTRIHHPVRGIKCSHINCFDLFNYIRLNDLNTPAWRCPVCNSQVGPDELARDEFTEKLLSDLPKNVTEIEYTRGDSSYKITQVDDPADNNADSDNETKVETTVAAAPPSNVDVIDLISDDEDDTPASSAKRTRIA